MAQQPTTTIDTKNQQGGNVLGNLTASAGNAGRMVAGQVQGAAESVLKKLHFSEYKSAVLAELFGSFILTLTVTLAQSAAGILSPIAVGFMYSSLIFTYFYISGGHFNPAMTLGVWLSKDGPSTLVWHKAVLYWLAQLLGATLAGFYSLIVHGPDFAVPLTPDTFYPGIFRIIITESVFTFLLVSVMLHTAHSKQRENSFHGFAVGMIYLSAGLANGGGVHNPAVATALIVVKCFTGQCLPVLHLWVYWTGELLGSISAAIFYNIASATMAQAEEAERRELEAKFAAEFAQHQQQNPVAAQQQQQHGNSHNGQQGSLRYGDAPQDIPAVARTEAGNDTPRMTNPNITNNNSNFVNRQPNPNNNNNNNFAGNNNNTVSPNPRNYMNNNNTQPPTPQSNINNNGGIPQQQQQYNQQQPTHSYHPSNQNNNNGEDVSPLYT